MNGSRSSRLQTFLLRLGRLKAAAGNNPERICVFDQTTAEIRDAATLMQDYLVGSEVEREMFRADKLIVHVPEGIESAWDEFKRLWEPGVNYLAMCEIDPDWPRDYTEHLRLYEGSSVVPDDNDELFLPGFHDGPAAIRQALDLSTRP